MKTNFQPLQLLLMMFAGWVKRHQHKVIDYLLEKNRVQKELHKGKRLRLNDNQRRRLAVKGKILERKLLFKFATIANILKHHGIEPARERNKRTTWKTFLKAHWETFAAADFFTVELWTLGGLVTFYVLFVIELSTRKVHLAGITHTPDESFMKQVARNLNDPIDGFLLDHRFLIIDRDGKYCPAFIDLIEECLNKMIFFGVGSLERAIQNYLDHYHRERNHQGLENNLISPEPTLPKLEGHIQSRERLGGLLRYYYRQAA